jgi:ubiquinone/menaquinone biosynthesis C-methylase UbiE
MPLLFGDDVYLSTHRRFGHDDPERRKWQNPEAILLGIGLKKGFTFVDVGCGSGFFTLPAAKIVGQEGKVYGVDVNQEAVQELRREAEKIGLRNIVLRVGEAEVRVLCEGCADIVFFGIDLHDFKDQAKVLSNAKRMLKLNGLLANLDWKKETMDIGPPLEIRFDEEKAANLIRSAGFKIEAIRNSGRYHYLITARQ